MPFKQIYNELQRRNVIRAALTYVAVSWVVLQAASIIFPALEIGQSVMRYLLLLLIIGFLPWLLFAWLYEYTGTGFRKTEKIALEESISKSTGKRMNAIIISSLALAVLLLLADRFYNFTGSLDADIDQNSIAVLPFENMSEEGEAFFTRGISEDILTQISKINNLKVLSRFTLSKYDTEGKSLSEIGKDLKVANLLAGNVRRSGNELRIGCQLINTKDETETWAQTFDRPLENVFAIQSEVAEKVAFYLRAELSEEAKNKIEEVPTNSLIAYNYFLKGRDQYRSYNGKDNENSISNYKLALEHDPDFALALAALSSSYSLAVNIFSTRALNYLDTALILAKRSTLLDPDASGAWNALGLAYDNMGDYENAKTMYLSALEKNPNNSTSISNLALILKGEGELVEAIDLQKKSIEINPINPSSYNGLSNDYRRLEMYKLALDQLEIALALDPENWITLYYFAYTHICTGDMEKARPYIEKMVALDPENPRYLEIAGELYTYFDPVMSRSYFEKSIAHPNYDSRINFFAGVGIGYFLWKEEKKDSANVWLNQIYNEQAKFVNEGSDELNHIMMMASIHAIRNENKQALTLLENMPRVSMDYVSWVLSPLSAGLQSYEPFKALIEEDRMAIEVMRNNVLQRSKKPAEYKD